MDNLYEAHSQLTANSQAGVTDKHEKLPIDYINGKQMGRNNLEVQDNRRVQQKDLGFATSSSQSLPTQVSQMENIQAELSHGKDHAKSSEKLVESDIKFLADVGIEEIEDFTKDMSVEEQYRITESSVTVMEEEFIPGLPVKKATDYIPPASVNEVPPHFLNGTTQADKEVVTSLSHQVTATIQNESILEEDSPMGEIFSVAEAAESADITASGTGFPEELLQASECIHYHENFELPDRPRKIAMLDFHSPKSNVNIIDELDFHQKENLESIASQQLLSVEEENVFPQEISSLHEYHNDREPEFTRIVSLEKNVCIDSHPIDINDDTTRIQLENLQTFGAHLEKESVCIEISSLENFDVDLHQFKDIESEHSKLHTFDGEQDRLHSSIVMHVEESDPCGSVNNKQSSEEQEYDVSPSLSTASLPVETSAVLQVSVWVVQYVYD